MDLQGERDSFNNANNIYGWFLYRIDTNVMSHVKTRLMS